MFSRPEILFFSLILFFNSSVLLYIKRRCRIIVKYVNLVEVLQNKMI